MECKGREEKRTEAGAEGIDLTRMECKVLFRVPAGYFNVSIDLTRMECKGI